MKKLSKRERIQATLKGQTVDRVPVSFWRHWPGDDQSPETLALAALDFQRRYDLDFIKLPVSSTFTVTDYGVKHSYQGSLMGDRTYLECVIKEPKDWDRIEPLDIRKGTYGWHLQALRMIMKQREADTPVIATMFNSLSIAAYAAGMETCLAHLRKEPERVENALKAITETSVRFARSAIDEGVDGIFLSTRHASFEIMSEPEYQRFGRPFDLELLKAAKGGWFNILHFHGQYPMLPLLADYPVQAINWHDRTTAYNLAEASKLFPGALMGGVEQYKVLHFGTPEDVEAQVRDATRQMEGRRLIVTPGCTYLLDVPHSNLLAMRKAVDILQK
jgi:uroporphyrinogen decarboxylase